MHHQWPIQSSPYHAARPATSTRMDAVIIPPSKLGMNTSARLLPSVCACTVPKNPGFHTEQEQDRHHHHRVCRQLFQPLPPVRRIQQKRRRAPHHQDVDTGVKHAVAVAPHRRQQIVAPHAQCRPRQNRRRRKIPRAPARQIRKQTRPYQVELLLQAQRPCMVQPQRIFLSMHPEGIIAREGKRPQESIPLTAITWAHFSPSTHSRNTQKTGRIRSALRI